MTANTKVEIAVVGAGIAGIATAYYLSVKYQCKSVLLIDNRQPMSFTSAQSGDNYRNWWPHPTMTTFTNHSIDLMEDIAQKTANIFNMTRRGYVLATRRHDIDDLIADLITGYGDYSAIRVHKHHFESSYDAPLTGNWETAPDGVDILADAELIKNTFASFDHAIKNIVHIRRAGDIDSQQLAQYMLQQFKQAGGRRIRAEVRNIEPGPGYKLTLTGPTSAKTVTADLLINAAGPFAKQLAAMIDIDLPLENVFQQKVAFSDNKLLIPRDLPFCIDLDDVELDWTEEERSLLAEEPEYAWLTQKITGKTHCRPVGGDNGNWVKLGWAYNDKISEPRNDLNDEPLFDTQFQELVIRAAARLQPSMKLYIQDMPLQRSHYGGYYTMNQENWPLIGPLDQQGAFVVGALSGFGSMSACAAGELCARQIAGKSLPDYAGDLSLARYKNDSLMKQLSQIASRGIL